MPDLAQLLDDLNHSLAQRPATEEFCGTQQTTVSLDGPDLVVESRWTDCPGTDRSVTAVRVLVLEGLDVDVTPEYGRARILVPCQDGETSGRFTRTDDESQWRHLRDEPVFTLDCAPDDHAAAMIVETLRALVVAARDG